MWCSMGKILFHCLALRFSLLPPVTVSPLALWWTPGSRVGFLPSLTSQILPLLLPAPAGCPHPNPEHPSCGAWLTFSRGLPNASLLSRWGGGNGNPRKALTPGKAGRALPLPFNKILLWWPAQNVSVVLFLFMLSIKKTSLWCHSLFVSLSNKLTTLPPWHLYVINAWIRIFTVYLA